MPENRGVGGSRAPQCGKDQGPPGDMGERGPFTDTSYPFWTDLRGGKRSSELQIEMALSLPGAREGAAAGPEDVVFFMAQFAVRNRSYRGPGTWDLATLKAQRSPYYRSCLAPL